MYKRQAKKMGIWVDDDRYTPKPADAGLYDWNDSGRGDNTGTPDHIGTVESVNTAAGTFTVIAVSYTHLGSSPVAGNPKCGQL